MLRNFVIFRIGFKFFTYWNGSIFPEIENALAAKYPMWWHVLSLLKSILNVVSERIPAAVRWAFWGYSRTTQAIYRAALDRFFLWTISSQIFVFFSIAKTLIKCMQSSVDIIETFKQSLLEVIIAKLHNYYSLTMKHC